jgi:Leucine-rich repeat (LRR) protein
MTNKISKLYNEVKEYITTSRLKEVSIEIINRFKKKDHAYLLKLAELAGIDAGTKNINRLFGQLIQLYHPDKLKLIQNEIESFYNKSRYDDLLRFKNIYFIDLKSIYTTVNPGYIDNTEFDSGEQGYGDDDFGYAEYEFDNNFDQEPDDEIFTDIPSEKAEPFEEHGFIEAVNRHFFGNLDLTLSISDLIDLEGELDLSDFEIDDLSGIEHCVNINVLNLSANNIIKIQRLSDLLKLKSLYLSQNNIEDVSCLSSLTGLKELDISFNNIEDISVLLELPDLTYINVINNPLSNKSVIDTLIKRGVIVIY